MVWCIEVELAGQVQPDRYLLTGGPLPGLREVTVGRPPAKAAVRPDIVVKDPSVSKIHAILSVEQAGSEQQGPALVLKDQSRYGTSVNQEKVASGGTKALAADVVVALAPKARLIVRQQPLVVAVQLGTAALPKLQELLRRIGGRVVHLVDGDTTHVLHTPGEAAWPGLVHAALRGGAAIVTQDWLTKVADGGLFVNALPEAAPPTELVLGLEGRAVQLPSQPPVTAGTLLSGFTFGYSSAWQQSPGLAALIRECGGRVLASAGERSAAAPVVQVVEAAGAGEESGIESQQLLLAVLEGDSAALNVLLSKATAAAAATQPGAAATAPAAADDMEADEPEVDSDMTQAAEEEGGDDAGAVEQLPPGRRQAQQEQQHQHPQQLQAGGKPMSVKTEDAGTAHERPPPAMTADGWLVATRKSDAPSPEPQLRNNPAGDEAAAAQTVEHEDAPPAKRRRTLANTKAASSAAAGPGPSSTNTAAPVATLRPMPPAAAAAAAAPALLAHSPEESPQEPDEAGAGPWLTQHTQRGRGSGKSWPPVVKEEAGSAEKPQTGPVAAPAGKARGAKAAAAAAAAVAASAVAGAASRMVKAEEAALPEVNDASAQCVLELDLFAPRAATSATERRAGGGDDEAAAENGADGDGTARAMEARRPGRLPNFKAFRKQAGQLSSARMQQPLPVTLVDNFQRTAEAEAFMRQEEERAARKRAADEMFRTGGVGGGPGAKKPPRAKR